MSFPVFVHKTRTARALLCLLLGATLWGQTAPPKRPADPSMLPVEEVSNLPRVLLIGDSISMGYTIPVRELLKDKANVMRPLENCGESARGLKKLDVWLGDKKWDVIHFNFGLHDLKYLDEEGTLPDLKPGGNLYLASGDALVAVRVAELLARKHKRYQVQGDRIASYHNLRGRPAVLIGQFNNQTGKVAWPATQAANRSEEYAIVNRVVDPTPEKTVVSWYV